MMTTKERNVTLMVKCTICNTNYKLKVAEEDYIEYTRPNRRHIQDIFPYLTPSERELLISHTCEECWNKMFGDEEDVFEDENTETEEPNISPLGEQNFECYTVEKVIEVIKDLAKSQGFYCRLLEAIENFNEDEMEMFKTDVESQRFSDPLDVVLYFES